MTMQREKRISAALKLLKPSVADRAICETRINTAVAQIERDKDSAQYEKDVASKAARGALRSYRAALHRAQNAERALPPGMRDKLALRTALQLVPSPDFPALLAACDKALDVRQLPMKADFGRYSAAVWAGYVLQSIGVRASVTRGGIWPKLAGILYGDPKSDFYNDCQSAKRSKPKEEVGV